METYCHVLRWHYQEHPKDDRANQERSFALKFGAATGVLAGASVGIAIPYSQRRRNLAALALVITATCSGSVWYAEVSQLKSSVMRVHSR